MLWIAALACGLARTLCGAWFGGTRALHALHHRKYQAMIARTAVLERELGLMPTAPRVPTIEVAIRQYGNPKPIRCDCPKNVICGYNGCPRGNPGFR
jgi:hypothetical protein